MPNTFIIHLRDREDRLNHISRELKKVEDILNWEIIDACNGALMADAEIYPQVDTTSPSSYFYKSSHKSEMACALSHIKCYETFCNGKYEGDFLLILEDDVVFKPSFKSVYESLHPHLDSSKPQIILLTPNFRYKFTKKSKLTPEHYIAPIVAGFTAAGYIINRRACELLKNKLRPVRIVADNWKEIRASGVNILGVVPHIIDFKTRTELDSSIAPVQDVKVDTSKPSLKDRIWCNVLKLYGHCRPIFDFSRGIKYSWRIPAK